MPGKLYGILPGAALPGYGTLPGMLEKWPEVSADWLIMGRSQMLRTEAGPASLALQQVVGGDKVVVVTVDDQGQENAVFVPVPAQAGYSVQHNEAVYFQQLNNYWLPGFERGEYRAFEVAGDSMAPTINHRDVVVAFRVEKLRLLKPGEV